MYTIKCVICGVEFQAKRPHAKYCYKCTRTAHNQYELQRNRELREQADEVALKEQADAHAQWLQEEKERQERLKLERKKFDEENPTFVYDKYLEMRNKRIEEDKTSSIESDWYIGGVHIYDPDFENELERVLIERGLLKGENIDNGK